VSKHIDGQKLEQSNWILKEASAQLSKERDSLQLRHDKQLSQLRDFEQALKSSRERLISVLDDWNHHPRLSLAGILGNTRGE
jgi:pterin-4a-carbinolamine dehydratase